MKESMRTAWQVRPLLIALVYFALASISLLVSRSGDGIATIWPAGGFAVACLATSQRRRRWLDALAVGAGSLGANIACGTPLEFGLLFTAANLAETLVVIALLSRCPFGRPSFVDVRQVACFCIVAAAGAAVSTAIASASVEWAGWRFAASWLATDFLGIVLVAPLVLLILDRTKLQSDGADAVRPARLVVAVLVVAVVCLGTFSQSSLPLLFLPTAALIGAAYAAGPLGAAASALVVTAIGSWALYHGSGPMMLIDGGVAGQALFLQAYLVVLLGCALPTAALQTARRKLVAELAERNRLLAMAERVAQLGHWHLELKTLAVTWSDEVFRLHGLPIGGEPSFEEALRAYHEDDRDRLVDKIVRSISTGEGFRLRARIVRPGGQACYVDVSGEAVVVNGTTRSLFGVVQDITEQVEVERGLEASREEALAVASRATVLSETDELTGLANRRRVLNALDEALREASASGLPLSVAMFDVDHFKRVNDLHGHSIGDTVLRGVAVSAMAAVRNADLIGRLGGEEFIALLPGADGAAAMQVAERIRQMIGERGSDGISPVVTVSVGVATFAMDKDGAELMRRADGALYQAKADGRNTSRMAV